MVAMSACYLIHMISPLDMKGYICMSLYKVADAPFHIQEDE